MLNLDSLKDVVGDDETMMRELLMQFLETTQQDIRQLQDAVAANNAKEVASFAHRIKGSCFVVGAAGLAELMAQLELSGRKDHRGQFTQLLAQAVEELAFVNKEIEGLMQ